MIGEKPTILVAEDEEDIRKILELLLSKSNYTSLFAADGFQALERIAKEGQLMVYKHKGFWSCMDTIRDMEYLNKLWNENNAKWKVW